MSRHIEHFYTEIVGHFTFPDFYRWLAAVVPPGATLVEVGVLNGQSAAFLGVELLRWTHPEDPPTRLDLVDNWDANQRHLVRCNLDRISRVLGELHGCGSLEAAKKYADHSLAAVFLDADHAYESIAADIDAWLPKVVPGGVLAGHDYSEQFPGVVRAVRERFDRIEVWRGSRFTGPRGDEAPGDFFPVWKVKAPSP